MQMNFYNMRHFPTKDWNLRNQYHFNPWFAVLVSFWVFQSCLFWLLFYGSSVGVWWWILMSSAVGSGFGFLSVFFLGGACNLFGLSLCLVWCFGCGSLGLRLSFSVFSWFQVLVRLVSCLLVLGWHFCQCTGDPFNLCNLLQRLIKSFLLSQKETNTSIICRSSDSHRYCEIPLFTYDRVGL